MTVLAVLAAAVDVPVEVPAVVVVVGVPAAAGIVEEVEVR
jgi:hypothetical protein